MRELTIAVAQAVSFPGETDVNLKLLQQLVGESMQQNADLLCLPEAFLTGYNRQLARDIALDAHDSRLTTVEAIARETGMALSFGYIERNPDEARPFVTHVVTDGTRRLVYRKTHLGPHEQDFFTAGNQLPVETIAGVRVGVHLCWEAHFPQVAATLRQRGAELLIAPFACGLSGQRRRDAWMRVLPARANDNGCYLAACNALRPKSVAGTAENDASAGGFSKSGEPLDSFGKASTAVEHSTYNTLIEVNAAENDVLAGADSIENGTLAGGGAIVFDPKGVVIAECFSSENTLIVASLPGPLPREANEERMGALSYFNHRRPELYE